MRDFQIAMIAILGTIVLLFAADHFGYERGKHEAHVEQAAAGVAVQTIIEKAKPEIITKLETKYVDRVKIVTVAQEEIKHAENLHDVWAAYAAAGGSLRDEAARFNRDWAPGSASDNGL